MKRLLVLTVCFLLGAAATANAGLIGSGLAGTLAGSGSDNATITWARYSTSVLPGLEEIVFKIGTITAPVTNIITVTGEADQPNVAANWVASSGGQIALSSGGTVAVWGANTVAYSASGLDAPQSMVNMATAETGLTFGRTAAVPQTTFGSVYFPIADTTLTFKGFSEFHGTWDTTSYLTNGSVLADLYVATGTNVTFTGELGLVGQEMLKGSFTSFTTPEPGTLTLLAAGLLGMVAYAWRKRK